MATVLAARGEMTGKRPIKLTAKMQGAGGLGNRLRGGVNKRNIGGGRLLQNVRKDGVREVVDDNDDEGNVTGIAHTSAAAADPASGAGDAAPLGVQVHADDFSDEEHGEEEEHTKLQTDSNGRVEMPGDGRKDTLNNITDRAGASPSTQNPAGSPLEGVAANDHAPNDRLADLERTTQQQSLLISSLLKQLNNGSASNPGSGAVGPASGSPNTSGTPRAAPSTQRATPVVQQKRKYPTMVDTGNSDELTTVYPSDSLVMQCLIVVHHKARGKHIPTDACVNADDIASYHRKVKAAIRKTFEESPDDQLPAWSHQHQGWVFGPTKTVVISGSGFPDLVPDAAEKKVVKLLFEYAQLEPKKGKKMKTTSNNSAGTVERDILDDVGEWEDAKDSV
ncbi:unnamed protein product [Closterium sp. Naga37s-1]|nr:unnamed protein product [Closterium sp. Naga37s-1]